MKAVSVGLLGLGTVGQGVANILSRNAEEIVRRCGAEVQVAAAAVRDKAKAEALGLGFPITTDPYDVVNDASIDIICEAMGGEQPALDLIRAAIDNGKHVVTANKALIALHGNELFERANQKGVMVAFEASVAGGIPVIKALREGLVANRIQWLAGIINGTGNYILTAMTEEGRDFNDVLAEAQALGYAEADPEFDVEGIDAAHKLTIMASVAFGIPLQFEKVYTEGITRIQPEDIASASEMGYRIKHLGVARRREDGIELRVHPTLVPARRLLANVNGVMNAVLIQGDAVGPTLYYGPGAGSEPTGSSVVADIVDVVRVLGADAEHQVPHLAFQAKSLKDETVLSQPDFESAYYLRLTAEDKPGVMAAIADIFGKANVSIEALNQKEPKPGAGADGSVAEVQITLLTRRVREGVIQQAIESVNALPAVTEGVTFLRVETLN